MFWLDVFKTRKVGYRPRNLANLIVRSGRQPKFGHRLLKQHLPGAIQSAEFLNLLVRHPRIGHHRPIAESRRLNGPAFHHILPHRSRVKLPRP
jgi:hypothetical protein